MDDPIPLPPGAVAPDRCIEVAVNRTVLRVWEWGDPGDPVVLAAHGAYDHGRMWDGVAPVLADRGVLVRAPDLRGHGGSGRLGSGHVWGEALLDLAALAAPDAPVGMIGHSMGGEMALNVANHFPDLVDWVVVFDTLGPPREAMDPGPLADQITESFKRIDRIRSGSVRTARDKLELASRRGEVNRRLPVAWLAHLVEHGSIPVDGGWAFSTDPMFRRFVPDGFTIEHLLAELVGVPVPVLAVMGAEDDTWSEMSVDEAAERAALIGDVRLHHVPGGGHYVHLEQPDACAALVHAFLDEIAGR